MNARSASRILPSTVSYQNQAIERVLGIEWHRLFLIQDHDTRKAGNQERNTICSQSNIRPLRFPMPGHTVWKTNTTRRLQETTRVGCSIGQ